MSDDAGLLASARGQSSIDFLIGFGVFFLTFSFVVALLPELVSPFAAQEGPAVANRAVETLASDLLATGTVGGLNAACTAEFFSATDESGCGFDGSDSPTTLLGLSGEYQLYVTLERDVDADGVPEVACYDYDGLEVVSCSSGTPLDRGPSPPGNTQTVRTARRVVELDEKTLLLELRVW